MRQDISKSIIISSILIPLICLAATGTYSYFHSRESLITQSEDMFLKLIMERADRYDELFRGEKQIQNSIAQRIKYLYETNVHETTIPDNKPYPIWNPWMSSQEMDESDYPEISKESPLLSEVGWMLKTFSDNTPRMSNMYYGTEDERCVFSDPGVIDILRNKGLGVTDRPWYKDAVAKGTTTWTRPYMDEITGNLVITLSTPVYYNGQPIGVIGFDILLDTMQKDILEPDPDIESEAFLLSQDGDIIVGSRYHDELFKRSMSGAEEIIKDMRSGLSGIQTYDNGKKYIAYAPLQEIGASTAIITKTENIVEPAAKQSKMLILISIAAIALSCYIGYAVSKRITRPLRSLTDSMTELGKGNLKVRKLSPSNSETGFLAIQFNKTLDNIREGRKELDKQKSLMENKIRQNTAELKRQVKESEDARKALLNMMEDFQESMEKQKKLERIKTDFLSVTSHELRTPITPMKAQLQMVLGEFFGKLSAKQKKSLDMVLRNTLRLDNLIGDILDISKLESGNMKFVMTQARLNDVVKDIVETMKLKATQKNIKVQYQQDKTPSITLDQDRIKQVVSNLINNAIKFTSPNGTISVVLKDKKKYAEIRVKDTGIGIAHADKERIFQPFVQVDSSQTRNFEGTGLGLAICKGIVKQHGGHIWVESTVGKGSTFACTIPYKTRHTVGKVELELFSYDEESMVNMARKNLARRGYIIKQGKAESMLREKLINADGTISMKSSIDRLLKKGYIKKKGAKR